MLWQLPPVLGLDGVMNTLVGLAGIGFPILASHDSEALTECVVLQASPGIVGRIEGLVLAWWEEVGGWDAIDCALEDWDEVLVKIGMWYPARGVDGDWGGRRTDCGGGEVCYKGGRLVYSRWVHGWSGVWLLGLIDLI